MEEDNIVKQKIYINIFYAYPVLLKNALEDVPNLMYFQKTNIQNIN